MLLDEITTRSKAFADVLTLIRRVSKTDANVLLTGETGTGKDYVAGLIHDASERRDRIFMKIDCASIPSALAESEFFGYEKGAFSDASAAKSGKLQLSRGGTVYLDGINHLSSQVQSKLLRFVQERKIEPLGSSKSYSVDCRLIASCSLPLTLCLQQKQLREDLYYRLAALSIDLPPLRDRSEDIENIATSMLREFNHKYKKKLRMNPATAEVLVAYRWPGNIRELRNVMEYAVIHSEGEIHPRHLPLRGSASETEQISYFADRMLSMEQVEKIYIAEVLRKVKGNQIKAAGILKMNRKTLMLKKRKYGL
jgi:transcriptional regulator with PAS, ATPase and Fis domain